MKIRSQKKQTKRNWRKRSFVKTCRSKWWHSIKRGMRNSKLLEKCWQVETLSSARVLKEETVALTKDLKSQSRRDTERLSTNNHGISKIIFSLLIKCRMRWAKRVCLSCLIYKRKKTQACNLQFKILISQDCFLQMILCRIILQTFFKKGKLSKREKKI